MKLSDSRWFNNNSNHGASYKVMLSDFEQDNISATYNSNCVLFLWTM